MVFVFVFLSGMQTESPSKNTRNRKISFRRIAAVVHFFIRAKFLAEPDDFEIMKSRKKRLNFDLPYSTFVRPRVAEKCENLDFQSRNPFSDACLSQHPMEPIGEISVFPPPNDPENVPFGP